MLNYSTSRKLINSSQNFLTIKHYGIYEYLSKRKGIFYGWGRKNSGLKAIKLAKKYNTKFFLLEDGFIRSMELGIDGSPSFSLVQDDTGIYYDATQASQLEKILSSYDFVADFKLMQTAIKAIDLIVQYNISKYNASKDIVSDFFTVDEDRVMIIAQTAGDASLAYGMLDNYSTDDMIDAAILENPDATVYLKVHPDVLSGKKESDIDIKKAKEKCIIIDEDINPLSLLKYFSKVYTKTSQMGFEALLVGCQCVCFGMPFYAGWGVTDDRVSCKRRKRKLNKVEIFAASYILYTQYYNPYTDKVSNIIDTINEIMKQKESFCNKT